MVSRTEVFDEINQAKNSAQDSIRRKYLKELSDYTGRDTIIVSSSFSSSRKLPNLPSYALSISNEDIQGYMAAFKDLRNNKLDIILHSPGGSLEAAQQIVKYIRSKYDHVRVIVPQNAMSAATMIACASDEIIMGKHSAIGPIDPQIVFSTATGHFSAPAQSILDEFEQAKEEIKKDPRTAPIWIKRIDQYPIGFLKICENTINMSKEVVAEWLRTWMLKEHSDKDVLSREIAEWLGDTNLHKTHGKPISISDAKNHGLIVNSLEENQDFQDLVLSVYHSMVATHEITNCTKFIENQNGKGVYLNFDPVLKPF